LNSKRRPPLPHPIILFVVAAINFALGCADQGGSPLRCRGRDVR